MDLIYLLLATILVMIGALLAFDRLMPATATHAGLMLERRRSGMSERKADIPGFTMPYLDGGSGDVPLLLIHGFGANKDNFTRMAGFLTPHFRVICPDLPGFGDATRDASARYGIADQVTRLHAFLQQLGIDKLHIGGNSMGGYIAAQFAATYPDLVVSAWLIDPAGTAAANESAIIKNYLASGEMPLLVATEADFAPLLASVMAKPPFMPYSVRTTFARRAVSDYPLHKQILTQFAADSPLLEILYERIETPALIVWGTEDKILHPDGATTLNRLFPNSKVKLMLGIGHLPMLESPKATAMDYLAFRQSHS